MEDDARLRGGPSFFSRGFMEGQNREEIAGSRVGEDGAASQGCGHLWWLEKARNGCPPACATVKMLLYPKCEECGGLWRCFLGSSIEPPGSGRCRVSSVISPHFAHKHRQEVAPASSLGLPGK